jgi:prolyl-tRNA synthetase
MVISPTGEDEILHCEKCDYAASGDMAAYKQVSGTRDKGQGKTQKIEKVKTPNIRTIEELEKFIKAPRAQMIKTLIYKVGDQAIAVLIRGDHELNEGRLKKILAREDIELADEALIEKVTKAPMGFAGPVGLKGIKIYADKEVTEIVDGITGGNEKDVHLTHVEYGRDYKADEIDNIRLARQGDLCPHCDGKLTVTRGIEVGHIFKLGTKYSAKMNATFLDESGKEKQYIMGCYGIGVSRIAGAVIEQCHDEFGIKWPLNVAPYKVAIVPVNIKESSMADVAQNLYKELTDSGVEVLFDDRDASIGVKLKDIDLIGLPIKVIIGPKSLAEKKVEIKLRADGKIELVPIEKAAEKIRSLCL